MSCDRDHQHVCGEEYAELCALSVTGELTVEESAKLDAHVAACSRCAELHREYTAVACVAMAKLAPVPREEPFLQEGRRRAERQLLAALQAAQSHKHTGLFASLDAAAPPNQSKVINLLISFVGVAAALLICIGGSFEMGRNWESSRLHVVPPAIKLPPPTSKSGDVADLEQRLASEQTSLNESRSRSAAAEKQIQNLSNAKALLIAQIDELSNEDAAASASLVAMTAQRDGLRQQLNATSENLDKIKEDLNQARQDRQGALLRVASLESDVGRLRAERTSMERTAVIDAQFLAQDRDIRELMGARQLYIADVIDVQKNGKPSKPFGRVFYTTGKSLIFYAFDLQDHPGYRETGVFQAWGKPDIASEKPISLGIFYMDNEANRRWVLKSDNPDVLDQINAVFVTVEPRGGSTRPTGKPLLEAYLHSIPPNHP